MCHYVALYTDPQLLSLNTRKARAVECAFSVLCGVSHKAEGFLPLTVHASSPLPLFSLCSLPSPSPEEGPRRPRHWRQRPGSRGTRRSSPEGSRRCPAGRAWTGWMRQVLSSVCLVCGFQKCGLEVSQRPCGRSALPPIRRFVCVSVWGSRAAEYMIHNVVMFSCWAQRDHGQLHTQLHSPLQMPGAWPGTRTRDQSVE